MRRISYNIADPSETKEVLGVEYTLGVCRIVDGIPRMIWLRLATV
jgi:hypothetical protein